MRAHAANFAGANLDEVEAPGLVADSASFTGATANKAVLERADLSRTVLRKADLRFARLRGAKLTYAKLEHAKLDHADLRDTDMEQVNVHRASRNAWQIDGANLKDMSDTDPELAEAEQFQRKGAAR